MSITVSKTRDVLVDVARQLFARMGIDHTTMNDIAQASQKGRRTLYTYFRSKEDIFLAVVESELDKLNRTLRDFAVQKQPADEKLIAFIYMRLDAVKTIVFQNGTLRAKFFRDIWRVAKARKKFDLQEIEIIKNILEEGVREGTFTIPDTGITALTLHYVLNGLEVPYIRGFMGSTKEELVSHKENIMHLIFNGIKITK
jgi:AcrR family transcriptional regulator